jgi:uncharacterized membrane protein (UPF0127 family)
MLGCLATLAGCALLLPMPRASFAAATATLVLKTDTGPHSFNIEVATTEEERMMGLMYRKSLAADSGMLFLYDTPQPIFMWMKNTYIPLDMVFIGADRRVHRVERRTEPFSTTLIPSDGDVQGVLEVNAGTADAIGLKAGDQVIYPDDAKP